MDWSATRAFNVVGTHYIWVNLRGRQPEGIVSAGREYDEVVSLIQQSLGEAVDPVTGKPAVKAVHRRTDLYHGPFLDKAPDLLVEWAEEPAQAGLAWYGDDRQVVVTHSITHLPRLVSGGHRKMGILVASGPPFKRGATIEGATLYDITPTLLYLLEQPVPASLDGRILTDALSERWLQTHAPRFVDEGDVEQDGSSGGEISMSAEDEEKVMERLRALGYVE